MKKIIFKNSLALVALISVVGVQTFFLFPYISSAQVMSDSQTPPQNGINNQGSLTGGASTGLTNDNLAEGFGISQSNTIDATDPDAQQMGEAYNELSRPSIQYFSNVTIEDIQNAGFSSETESSQASAAISGAQREQQQATALIDQATVNNAVTCSVGAILANGLSAALTTAIESLVVEKVEEKTTGILKVPVNDETGNANTRLLANKEASSLKIRGIPVLPGWDAIGYCLINTIIDYISQSTINWINRGFNGNPAFVDNPEQFFRDVADIEGGAFLTELSEGVLCQPFDTQIQLNLLRHQIGRYGKGMPEKCTLSETVRNVENFVNNDFNEGGWQGWFSLTQDPFNNPYEAFNNYQNLLNARVGDRKDQLKIELDWGRGFLSFRDPETGKITSPGVLIENRLNERLGSAERRIEMSDEFDDIITALVNQLVRVALSELLQSSSGNQSGFQQFSPQNINPLSPRNVLGN